MARPGKKRRGLFILEIVVLMLFIGGLFVYGQITTRLDKLSQPKLDKEKIQFNDIIGMTEGPKLTGYKTYAIFGVDSRGEGTELSASNSDTMIIVSVNNDTKQVKMVSVYRDTLLNVGNDTYTKANAAYAYGGPERAISMLNTNLDLNITDYATADFSALAEIVDAVGGLDIPLSYEEIEHVNNYCVETSKVTGKSFTKIKMPDPAPADQTAIIGTYHLNGVQATSYCRIRYTASLDMGRTERQRTVISMIVDKAKSASLPTLLKLVDAVFPMVETSIPKDEILKLIPVMLSYEIGEKAGFPVDYKFSNVKGSIIVPTSLESNVTKLHEILYGTAGYTPSSEVSYRSEKILEIVGGSGKLDDAAAAPSTEETETEDTFIWADENGSGGNYDNSYDNSYDGGYDDSYGGSDGSYDNSSDGSYDDNYGGSDGSYDDNYGGGDYDDNYGGGDGNYDDGSGDGGYDDGGYDDGGYDDGGGDAGYDDSGDFSDGYAVNDGEPSAESLSEQTTVSEE